MTHSNYISRLANLEGLEEIDLAEVQKDDDEEAEREATEKIQTLEDRSRITASIEELQTQEEAEAEPNKAPIFEEENIEGSNDEVHSFADLHCKLAALPGFGSVQVGESACLERLQAMHDEVAAFVTKVRLKEGLLSKAIVTGEKPEGNKWNEAMHELHLAKQYARYRGARSSRFSMWMSSQETLAADIKKASKQEDSELRLEGHEHIGPLGPLHSILNFTAKIPKLHDALLIEAIDSHPTAFSQHLAFQDLDF